MRSMLLLGLMVSVIALAGCCCQKSTCYEVRADPCDPCAAVSKSAPTEVIYVSKPAPEQRSAEMQAPPAPPIPAASAVAGPCDPCDPCAPRCKPLCNPLKRIFCCPGGG